MNQFFTKVLSKRTWLVVGCILVTIHLSKGQTLPTAMQTVKAMTIGWNLGNTLEAIGGETAWGNPLTTQRLIDSVKVAGFNTVRIPCAWDIHANQSTHQIDAAWIARVKQIVDYCIDRNLYVILNIHWDNGWLENNCTEAKKNEVNTKQNAYWTQIANYFKSYDGRLLFASANEPAVENAAQMAVLLSYHQTFINAVRATGGNNGSRVLVVQGPKTDIEVTNNLMNNMPTDKIQNRLVVEVHYYTPYQFTLMTEDASWGKMFYYWGKNNHSSTDASRNPTWGEESDMEKYFGFMKTKFIDKGIPVIIGETAVSRRTNLTGSALTLHKASHDYYYQYIAGASKKYGIPLIYWDPGFIGNNSSTLFDRSTGAVVDRTSVRILMKGMGIMTDLEEEVALSKEISLSPNPFHSHLQINAEEGDINDVSILDIKGKVLETINPIQQGNTLSVGAHLNAGVYILQVRTSKGIRFYQVIKN